MPVSKAPRKPKKDMAWRVLDGILIVFGVVLALVLVPLIGLFAFWMHDMCGAEPVERVPSPDGRWDAVGLRINCGATTPYFSAVRIVRHGARIEAHARGNVYGSGDDYYDLKLRWDSPDQLVISGRAKDRYGRPPWVPQHWGWVQITFVGELGH